MPQATVNGIRLHYRATGQGFPVVLIHGFTGNLRNWSFQIPALRQGYRVASLDLRGHGHSQKPTLPQDYTLEVMAEDVYALIRHLDLGECCVVGHSMGGMIAQHLVLAHPEAVRALVLVDTAAEMPQGLRTAQNARLMEIAQERGMEAVFEEQLKTNPLAQQIRADPQLLEMWRRDFLLTSREAYLYCARAIAHRRPLLQDLAALRIPTLIICGENDEPFLEPSIRMHQRIPGSDLAIIPGAGHSPQMESPMEFNQLLLRFLSRIVVASERRPM